MALIPCLECNKEIGSTVNICPHCGTNQIEFQNLTNNYININNNNNNNFRTNIDNKFNWWAFFFNTVYYGGYGKLGKAFFLSILSFIPLTRFFVSIYCGKKANSELPIYRGSFSFPKAFLIFFIDLLIAISVISFIESIREEKLLKKNINEVIKATNTIIQEPKINQEEIQKEVKSDDSNFDEDSINLVKRGRFKFDEGITLSQALDGYKYFSKINWSSKIDPQSRNIIVANCKLVHDDRKDLKDIFIILEFYLNNQDKTFKLHKTFINFSYINNENEVIEANIDESNLEKTSLDSIYANKEIMAKNAMFKDEPLKLSYYLNTQIEFNKIMEKIKNQSTQTQIPSPNLNSDNNKSNEIKKETVNNIDNNIDKNNFENIKYSGTIGKNINFHISLTRNGNDLTGIQYYDISKKNITVEGSIDQNNEFILYELDIQNKTKRTGVFKGRIIDINNISGIWSTPDEKTKLDFKINKL